MIQLEMFPRQQRNPTWDDVQKDRATAVRHGAYARPCRDTCLWADSVFNRAGEPTCYLLARTIVDGMCPGGAHLEWTGR